MSSIRTKIGLQPHPLGVSDDYAFPIHYTAFIVLTSTLAFFLQHPCF